AAGHTVHREYYINDGVNSEQMRLFAESVRALFLGDDFPEKGYKGDYVQGVADFLDTSDFEWRQAIEMELSNLYFHLERLRKLGETEEAFKGYDPSRLRIPEIEAFAEALRERKSSSVPVRELMPTSDTALSYTVWQRASQLAMLEKQRVDLEVFGVTFDTWFSEQSLHDNGAVQAELEELESSKAADENPYRLKLKLAKGGKVEDVENEDQAAIKAEEGDEEIATTGDSPTVWLRSTKFGDDMDRVLKRRDGRLTYIASDVAYHKDKFNRPADGDKLITVLGPDHHGYIGRLTAVVAAMLLADGQVQVAPSDEPLSEIDAKIYTSAEERDRCRAATALAREKLDVQIFQIVRFVKDGKPAPMRKRDGNIYALIDLVNEIGAKARPSGTTEEKQAAGRDVARFFYLMRHHDTAMDFDLDLAEKQSDENPVFYAQYAHARICSVLDKAAEAGFPAAVPSDASDPLWNLLVEPKEKTLALKVLDLRYEVARCAEDYAVNRLTTYAVELARTYHAFYDACRVIQPDQPELSKARVALCAATRSGLRAVFNLLGIGAPDRMEREA
ncbi:MAG: hypothetical protein JSS65_12000, partial [Armatimonadetes bacterium]|nr:hypothetical protein [Armatimonadota bacterium]